MAARWGQLNAPYRPIAEDLALYWQGVEGWVREHGVPRVLLLGVTPELYHLPWPEGTDFLAADRNPAMIDRVWPGPPEQARCGDWLELGLAAGSRDLALTDGGVDLLPYPEGVRRLVELLRELLTDQGRFVFRLYAQLAPRESPEAIVADLRAGLMPNRAILEMRMGAAIQEDATAGVTFGEIWEAIYARVSDPEGLALSLGWAADELRAAHLARPALQALRMHHLTVEQLCALFCEAPGGFVLESVSVPDYEHGALCPTITFRREG